MAVVFSVLAVLASLLLGSTRLAIGAAAGGAIMTGDIYLLRRVVTGLFGADIESEKVAKGKRRLLLFQYLLKVIGLLVILAALVLMTNIHPAGLLLGVTAAIIGPMYVGLRDANIEESEDTDA